MTVAYGSVHNGGTSGTTDTTVTKPASTANGDLLLANIWFNGTLGYGTTGFTQLDVSASLAGPYKQATAYKVAGASEPADYTFDNSGGGYIEAEVIRITGGDTTSPINAHNLATGVDTNLSNSGITTTIDGCLLIALITTYSGNPLTTTPAGTSGFTQIEQVSGGDDASYWKAQATQGATGSVTATKSGNMGFGWGLALIAIAPASSGVTTTQTLPSTARITAQTTKTLTSVARITATATQTLASIARIQITSTQTLASVARITAQTTQTLASVARITATATQTLTSIARIQRTMTQTLTSTANITVTGTTQQTLTSTARITATAQQTLTSTARIGRTATQTLTSVARVQITSSQTLTSVARIQQTVAQTLPSVARITATTLRTLTSTARIFVSGGVIYPPPSGSVSPSAPTATVASVSPTAERGAY